MKSYYLKDDKALQNHFDSLTEIKHAAIDTEFMRRDTYFAIPALVQVAYEINDTMHAICCDAKHIKNWQPLNNFLSNLDECIMHSPDQDFEIFDIIFTEWNFNIIDTQLASALLGSQPQISYAGLIENELEVEIDKSQSRTNWLKRPLSEAQIEYALSDVTYLLTAWKKVKIKLVEQERTDWFEADCARFIPEHAASKNLNKAWKKVKGIRRLDKHEFPIAAQLAEWRESKAQERDLPRRWLLADEVIIELAENPRNLASLATQWKVLKQHQDEVENLTIKPDPYYSSLEGVNAKPLNEKQKDQLQSLKAFCAKQAANLDIETNTLTNRKTMERIVRGNTDFLDVNNWRHQILLDYINTK